MINIKKYLSIALLGLITLSSCVDDEDSYTQGVWERKSDFDGVARSQASSFTIGNKGYLCCGYTGKKTLNDLWVYDADQNYWSKCTSMPDEALSRLDAAAFSINGKGYITVGYNKESMTYLKDTWEYDPDTDTWTKMDDFPGGERVGAIAFSINGYGYVGCGKNDNYLKDFYRFDPTAPSGSQWQIVNGYGGTKRVYGTSFVIDNVAYICCGQNNGSAVYDFWKFDGNTWTQLRDIEDTSDYDYDDDYAIVRWNAVSFVIDGKGYITSGYNNGNLSDYWVYYPETDLWYGDSDDEYTPFEGTARYQSVSFSTGTRGFIVTGGSGGSYYFDDMWELLPYELED